MAKKKTKEKEAYFCKSALIERGWTETLINELLPEPVLKRNPYYSSAPQMQTWAESIVLTREESKAFKARLEQKKIADDKKQAKKEQKENEILELIKDIIPVNPIDEYPNARSIERKFILHIGPTNSGKTYDALERLKTAKQGTYLSPLRLLALEIYDKFNNDGVRCSMITGEERLDIPCSSIVSSTIELLNTNIHYDIAVVDEVQMISDGFRGYNWTRAILGLYADEIHLCMAPEAEKIAIKLIEECGDTYEIIRHERQVPLIFDSSYVKLENVQPGDALIVFSRRDVLSLAADLESMGIKTSVIYGALPPASRREQVRKFASGETDVVVCTDVIAMGINLPIKRVVFVKTTKFDGKKQRLLTPGEIKQIAGRAGRYGMYDEGYVLSMQHKEYVKESLNKSIDSIDKAYLGFTEELSSLPFKLSDIAEVWSSIETDAIYEKMDLTEIMYLYNELVYQKLIKENSKQDIYRMITCPIDTKNQSVLFLWIKYCKQFKGLTTLPFPNIAGQTLETLETEYKCLDLYFQFSRRFNMEIKEKYLRQRKIEIEQKIDAILKKNKKNYIKRCRYCGKPLPFDFPYGICEECYGDEDELGWEDF